MTAAKRATVKVRWERGDVIGPWMSPDEAADLVADIEQRVIDCGDGYGFVPFTGFDGRDVLIRGREVITIECLPETPARLMPPTFQDRPAHTLASGGSVQSLTIDPSAGSGEPTPATQFLRQQTARHQANGARR